jgi:thiol:disulfide interchange protein DsbC
MIKKLLAAFVLLFSVSSPLLAAADSKSAPENNQSQVEKAVNDVFNKIGGKVLSVKPAPVKGLYEILIEKDGRTGIVYLDEEKKHLLQGMILDINALQPVFSHPQELLQPKQKTSLDVSKIPVESAFIIGNPKGAKKLYVFTDPDCPYCHKMHVELKKLASMAPDVAIHIMLFPLPMHPAAYDKSRAVLETMSQDVLDKAFEGKEVPKPTKESSKASIDAVIKFAGENGISGTPAMVTGNGKILMGFKSSTALQEILSKD